VGSGMSQRVDVVVVSYNSAGWLRGCVEPLAGAPGISVAVVDNASKDDSVASVAGLPLRMIELERNVGFAAGCNVGWRATDSPAVLFLNPDACMQPDDVCSLADVLERTAAGAVAPKIVDPSGSLEWSMRRFPAVRSIYGQALFAHRLFPQGRWVDEVIRDPERYETEDVCDWASGACLLVDRKALEHLNGFDERFFLYREDVDLCRRLWDADYKVVYTPKVTCVHAGGASAPRWRLMRVLARSRIRYARKHFGPRRAAAYRLGVGLSSFTHMFITRGLHRRIGHVYALLAVMGLNTQF
jgi:N-acetylglucosaminyl-diphospho-decaprenol L-rhamnosyltransferase